MWSSKLSYKNKSVGSQELDISENEKPGDQPHLEHQEGMVSVKRRGKPKHLQKDSKEYCLVRHGE